jgi:hypothetical protein
MGREKIPSGKKLVGPLTYREAGLAQMVLLLVSLL